jgi:hypothetical protein
VRESRVPELTGRLEGPLTTGKDVPVKTDLVEAIESEGVLSYFETRGFPLVEVPATQQ